MDKCNFCKEESSSLRNAGIFSVCLDCLNNNRIIKAVKEEERRIPLYHCSKGNDCEECPRHNNYEDDGCDCWDCPRDGGYDCCVGCWAHHECSGNYNEGEEE